MAIPQDGIMWVSLASCEHNLCTRVAHYYIVIKGALSQSVTVASKVKELLNSMPDVLLAISVITARYSNKSIWQVASAFIELWQFGQSYFDEVL